MPDTIRVISIAKQGPAGPEGPIGPPFGVGEFSTSTDPAVDAAVTQEIVDASDGVVITLTAAGNAQTIAAPSDTTPGKAFAVVNDTASGAFTVTVNGIVISSGAMVDFRWDGAAYALDSARLVDSVNGKIGVVVIDPDDLDDSSTANKFTTQAEIDKLSGIETDATADQTGAEIKIAYESEADTNAFTDAEQTKLSGVESGATADQTDAEIKTAYENNADTNAFTDAEQTKLTGIEAGAEVNQTPSEIKTDYESNADTNEFSDAEQTKLAGIEDGAKIGDVVGPASAVDGNVALFDTTTGQLLKDGGAPAIGTLYVSTAVDLLTAGQNIIGVTDTSVLRTITISTADITNISTIGSTIAIKDESGGAGTNAILIDTEGSETIDGLSDISIDVDFGGVILYSNGSNLFTLV
ncbi:MAG: hypothetical protein V3U60_16410 [Gammaproteobacteria bacterium]